MSAAWCASRCAAHARSSHCSHSCNVTAPAALCRRDCERARARAQCSNGRTHAILASRSPVATSCTGASITHSAAHDATAEHQRERARMRTHAHAHPKSPVAAQWRATAHGRRPVRAAAQGSKQARRSAAPAKQIRGTQPALTASAARASFAHAFGGTLSAATCDFRSGSAADRAQSVGRSTKQSAGAATHHCQQRPQQGLPAGIGSCARPLEQQGFHSRDICQSPRGASGAEAALHCAHDECGIAGPHHAAPRRTGSI